MANLNSQAASAVAINADFVTVMMGGNDVCIPGDNPYVRSATIDPVVATNLGITSYGMTSEISFTTTFRQAMNTLTDSNSLANTRRIFVVSIPNVNRLYALFKNNFWARFIWAVAPNGGICQSLLANPTSNTTADTSRRATVAAHVVKLNAILQTVCAEFRNCRYDNNKVYDYVFQSADITTRDYFHPSITGQKNLATTAYTAYLAAP